MLWNECYTITLNGVCRGVHLANFSGNFLTTTSTFVNSIAFFLSEQMFILGLTFYSWLPIHLLNWTFSNTWKKERRKTYWLVLLSVWYVFSVFLYSAVWNTIRKCLSVTIRVAYFHSWNFVEKVKVIFPLLFLPFFIIFLGGVISNSDPQMGPWWKQLWWNPGVVGSHWKLQE